MSIGGALDKIWSLVSFDDFLKIPKSFEIPGRYFYEWKILSFWIREKPANAKGHLVGDRRVWEKHSGTNGVQRKKSLKYQKAATTLTSKKDCQESLHMRGYSKTLKSLEWFKRHFKEWFHIFKRWKTIEKIRRNAYFCSVGLNYCCIEWQSDSTNH